MPRSNIMNKDNNYHKIVMVYNYSSFCGFIVKNVCCNSNSNDNVCKQKGLC